MADATILRRARDLIADRDHWTTHTFGRNPNGENTTNPSDAVQFCAVGACAKAASCESLSDGDFLDEIDLLGDCAADLFNTGVVDVNDGLGHTSTLQAAVGGYIQGVALSDGFLFCNEEGKNQGLAMNPKATQLVSRDRDYYPDFIVGTVVVVGPPDSEGDSLPIPPVLIERCRNL